MAGIHALEADLLGQGDHGRARGLIVRASEHRRLFAARRIADQCRGNGRERSDDAPCGDEARKLLGRACTVVPLQLVAACAGGATKTTPAARSSLSSAPRAPNGRLRAAAEELPACDPRIETACDLL